MITDQMRIEFSRRPTPASCPHERRVLDPDKAKPKSECGLPEEKVGHTIWTTCREHGYCTLWDDYAQ